MRQFILLCLLSFAAPAMGAPPELPPDEVVEATLTQAEVKPWLSQGPQPLVAAVRVRPAFSNNRFVGFRIKRFVDPVLAANRSIRVDDVLTRVNGKAIERPDQFMKAWEAVRGADHLELEVLRGTVRLLFRWKIVP